jgi:hypothetical protein
MNGYRGAERCSDSIASGLPCGQGSAGVTFGANLKSSKQVSQLVCQICARLNGCASCDDASF